LACAPRLYFTGKQGEILAAQTDAPDAILPTALVCRGTDRKQKAFCAWHCLELAWCGYRDSAQVPPKIFAGLIFCTEYLPGGAVICRKKTPQMTLPICNRFPKCCCRRMEPLLKTHVHKNCFLLIDTHSAAVPNRKREKSYKKVIIFIGSVIGWRSIVGRAWNTKRFPGHFPMIILPGDLFLTIG
jgi:hypothetical protein